MPSMKVIPTVIASVGVAFCAVAIAILSVQNATPVSLLFLGFQSIKISVGIVLAISVGIGTIGGAIAPLLWGDFNNGEASSRAANFHRYQKPNSDENW